MSTIKLDSVMEALRTVRDANTGKDIMSLGMVRDLKIQDNNVSLRIVMKAPTYPVRAKIEEQVKEALISKAGAIEVNVKTEAAEEKKSTSVEKHTIPGVKHIIAVSSGKGGVGKSTVATNLAVALHQLGYEVGLLDTDVYGPNVPTMMGVNEPPSARMDEKRGELLEPLLAHGVRMMSMGVLTRGDQPLIWRGPMLHSVVNQFLLKVDWGNLDYLIIDMPPGTGDVQLSLTQLVKVSGAVVVTTPQEVSMQDVRKAVLMFEKVGVPLLGVVENMSYFVCDQCDKHHSIFGSGGGQLLADKYHSELLAEIPLGSEVRESGDAGAPVLVRHPESIQAKAFLALAKKLSEATERSQREEPGLEIGQF